MAQLDNVVVEQTNYGRAKKKKLLTNLISQEVWFMEYISFETKT